MLLCTLSGDEAIAVFPLYACTQGQDVSPSGLTVTLPAGLTYGPGPDDHADRAALLDGTAATLVTIPADPLLDTGFSLSVLLHVYVDGPGKVFEFGNDGVQLHYANPSGQGEFLFYPMAEDGSQTPPVTHQVAPQKAWYHVAVTYDYDSSTARLYVDAKQVGRRSYAADRRILTTGDVVVGGDFEGRISCVQVYEKALPASKVKKYLTCPLGEEGFKGKGYVIGVKPQNTDNAISQFCAPADLHHTILSLYTYI